MTQIFEKNNYRAINVNFVSCNYGVNRTTKDWIQLIPIGC